MKINTRVPFLVLLGILILFLAGHNFYRYFLVKDYVVHAHTSCDPSNYSCFTLADATGSPTVNNKFYSKVTTDSAHAPKCLDEQNCENFVCARGAVACTILYCTEQNLEEGEKCSNQQL